ncbi:MAG TPA: DUF2510 domain-containing protein [Rhodoglobus sp.]|nr:DUF2510 domain-containing protein [Rhodoglobus sp.]
MDDNGFGVPAGWYPDPLGLPQLRWWDSQAWTEHTSEARAPIVIQPGTAGTSTGAAGGPRVQYADDEEFPSRREQRERERERAQTQFAEPEPEPEYEPEMALDTEADQLDEELSAQPLLAMTLRELEPPVGSTAEEAASPRRAATHANAAPAASMLSALAEELEEAPEREIKQRGTYTAAVWMIAALPLVQTLISVGLLTGGLGHNFPLFVIVAAFPYVLTLGLAAYDRLELRIRGFEHPASALWALLTHPAYLIARAIATFKENGKGFAPLIVFVSSLVGVVVGVLAMPGIVISLAPATFEQEIEQKVATDATAFGADITVDCPFAPVVIGETVVCSGESVDGASGTVLVSLERQAGWISWQVQDWGGWILD